MNRAEKMVEFIKTNLAAGNTVMIATYLRAWKLTKKHTNMVKVVGASAYMQNGKRWDCIDYCHVSAIVKK